MVSTCKIRSHSWLTHIINRFILLGFESRCQNEHKLSIWWCAPKSIARGSTISLLTYRQANPFRILLTFFQKLTQVRIYPTIYTYAVPHTAFKYWDTKLIIYPHNGVLYWKRETYTTSPPKLPDTWIGPVQYLYLSTIHIVIHPPTALNRYSVFGPAGILVHVPSDLHRRR